MAGTGMNLVDVEDKKRVWVRARVRLRVSED